MLPGGSPGRSVLRLVVHFCNRKFVVVVPPSATFRDLKIEIARVHAGIATSPSNTSLPTVAELQDGYGCVLFDEYSVGSVLRDLLEVFAFTADQREQAQDSCTLPRLVPPLTGSPQKALSPWPYGSGMLYPFQGLWPFTGYTPPTLPFPSQFITPSGPAQTDTMAVTPSSLSVGSYASELPPQTPTNLQTPAVPDEHQTSPSQHESNAVMQNIQHMFEADVSEGSTTALQNQGQQVLTSASENSLTEEQAQSSVASDPNPSAPADISLPAMRHPLATLDDTSVSAVDTHTFSSRTVGTSLLASRQGSGSPQPDLRTTERSSGRQAEGSSTSETSARQSFVALKELSETSVRQGSSHTGAVLAGQNVTCPAKESESQSEELQVAVGDSRNGEASGCVESPAAVGLSEQPQPEVRRLEFSNSSSDSEAGADLDMERDAISPSFRNGTAKSLAAAFKLAETRENRDSQASRPLEQPSGTCKPSSEGTVAIVTAPKPNVTALDDSGSSWEGDDDDRTVHTTSAVKRGREESGDRTAQGTIQSKTSPNVRKASVVSSVKTRLQLRGGERKAAKGKPPNKREQTPKSRGKKKSLVGNRQNSPGITERATKSTSKDDGITEKAAQSTSTVDGSLVVEEAGLFLNLEERDITREENSAFVATTRELKYWLRPLSSRVRKGEGNSNMQTEMQATDGVRVLPNGNHQPFTNSVTPVRAKSKAKSKPATKSRLSTGPRKGKSKIVRGKNAEVKTRTGGSETDTLSRKEDGKTSAVSKTARTSAIKISTAPNLSSSHSTTGSKNSTGSRYTAASRRAAQFQTTEAEPSSSDWTSSDEEGDSAITTAAVKKQVKSRSSSEEVAKLSHSQTLDSSNKSSDSNTIGAAATKTPKQSHSGSKTNETHFQSKANGPSSSKRGVKMHVEVNKPSKQVPQKAVSRTMTIGKPATLAKQTIADDSSESSSDSDDEGEDATPKIQQPPASKPPASAKSATAISRDPHESEKQATQLRKAASEPEAHPGKGQAHVRPVGSTQQTVDLCLSKDDSSSSKTNLPTREDSNTRKDIHVRVGSTTLPYKGSHTDSDSSGSESADSLKDRTQPSAATSASMAPVSSNKLRGSASSELEPGDAKGDSTSARISEISLVGIPDIGEEITVLCPPARRPKHHSNTDSHCERASESRETGRPASLGDPKEKPASSDSSEDSSSEEDEDSGLPRDSVPISSKTTLEQSDRGSAFAKSIPSVNVINPPSHLAPNRGSTLAKSIPSVNVINPPSHLAPNSRDGRQSDSARTPSHLRPQGSSSYGSRALPSLHRPVDVRLDSSDVSDMSEEILALETQELEDDDDVTMVPDTQPMEIDCRQDEVNVIQETQEEEESERAESPEIPLLGLLARRGPTHVKQRDKEPPVVGDGDLKQKREATAKIEVIDLTTPEPPEDQSETNAVAEVTRKISRHGKESKASARKKKLKSTHISVLDGSEEVQLGDKWLKKKRSKLSRDQSGRKDGGKGDVSTRSSQSGSANERSVPVLKAATSESGLTERLGKSERNGKEDQDFDGTASYNNRERKDDGRKSKAKITKPNKIDKSVKKSVTLQVSRVVPPATGLTARNITHSDRGKAQLTSEEASRSKLIDLHSLKARVEGNLLTLQRAPESKKQANLQASGINNSAISKRIPSERSKPGSTKSLSLASSKKADANQLLAERKETTAVSSWVTAAVRPKTQAATTAAVSLRTEATAGTGSLRRTHGSSAATKAVTTTESSDSSSSSEGEEQPGTRETPQQRRSSASFAALLDDGRRRKDPHSGTSSGHKGPTLLARYSSSSASRHRFSSEASMRLFSLSHTVHPLKRRRPAGSAVTTTQRRKKHKSGESKTEELNLSTLSQEEVEYSRTASQKLSDLLDDELLWGSKK